MLLAPIPWAKRIWALPFLTALAPSERYCRERGRRHKKLTDWARQMALQARRWLPGREIVLLGDSSFAALEFLVTLARHDLIGITRLRLDAALYEPAPPRRPGMVGRPRTKGARLPNLAEVLAHQDTRWMRVTVPSWYGEGDRAVEICSATAIWRPPSWPNSGSRANRVARRTGPAPGVPLSRVSMAESSGSAAMVVCISWSSSSTRRRRLGSAGVSQQRPEASAAAAVAIGLGAGAVPPAVGGTPNWSLCGQGRG